MDSRNIKPINHNSVHKICSGQVVLTLATAVKELVENSIDAGATIIEIKLKEYGCEQIEVTDNGKGVKTSDFQSITLKHHTSKISDFSDVSFVSTFGFRGEALSSLCALSNVEIITCHSTSNAGTFLVYDHDGLLVKSSPTHRQVGTTVIVKNLFFTLPVRHKEFLRNIRREYAKMLQLLTAYCLISIHKRITCTNVTDKGRKTVVLSTNSCSTIKDNITCIFGSKQVNNLMEFVQHFPSESDIEEYCLPKTDIEKCKMFSIEGYISRSTHGEGRSSTDRQFFFINGRPCDLPKVSKLINEVYHSFNKAQYPFVFLNINLTEGSADVNVTPDKRQIFIPEEKLLLCIIKTSVLEMYQLQPSQMKISSSSLFFQNKSTEDGSPDAQLFKLSEGNDEFSLKRKLECYTSNSDQDFAAPSLKNLRKDDTEVEENNKDITNADYMQSPPNSVFPSPEAARRSDISLAVEMEKESPLKVNNAKCSPVRNVNFALTLPFNEEKAFKNTSHAKSGNLSLNEILQKACRGKGSLGNSVCTKFSNKSNRQKAASDQKNLDAFVKMNKETEDVELNTCVKSSSVLSTVNGSPSNCSSDFQINSLSTEALTSEDVQIDEHQSRKKKCRTIGFSIEAIKKDIEAKRKNSCDGDLGYRKFRSKINPSENTSAEEELKKEIKKENFSHMDIIGQFNLGFIITRLNDDLFIVDQHATDEKYNYETLQKEIVLETQKLLNPQNLNLTAVSEVVLLDNLHVFEKSGFKFNIDESKNAGNKIQLISVPVSHNWSFGREDVDEMIFMLTDNPVSMVRPSRVNQMFASKACRKSVMIGTALTVPMMKKLIVHMGEIEQPWNCPHGRPTMRHLFSLNLLKTV